MTAVQYLSGAMNSDAHFRTRIISNLSSTLMLTGSEFFTHLFFSVFSAAGLFYYYLTGGRHWALLIFLILPSSLIWTSIAGKEAIFFGAAGVALVIWSKYSVEKITFYDFIFLAASLLICAFFRPHYALAFGWLFLSIYVLKKFQKNAPIILLASLFLFAIISYFYMWNDLLIRGFGSIDPAARASRYELLDLIPFTDEGFLKYKTKVMLGMIWGIVGPLPSEASIRLEFQPFFIEGILIFLFPVIFIIFAMRFKLQYKMIFFFCLVPAIFILLFMHAPFGILNPGTAIRWRVNFEQVFYLAPMLLFFRIMDVSSKENSSLPSKW